MLTLVRDLCFHVALRLLHIGPRQYIIYSECEPLFQPIGMKQYIPEGVVHLSDLKDVWGNNYTYQQAKYNFTHMTFDVGSQKLELVVFVAFPQLLLFFIKVTYIIVSRSSTQAHAQYFITMVISPFLILLKLHKITLFQNVLSLSSPMQSMNVEILFPVLTMLH